MDGTETDDATIAHHFLDREASNPCLHRTARNRSEAHLRMASDREHDGRRLFPLLFRGCSDRSRAGRSIPESL